MFLQRGDGFGAFGQSLRVHHQIAPRSGQIDGQPGLEFNIFDGAAAFVFPGGCGAESKH